MLSIAILPFIFILIVYLIQKGYPMYWGLLGGALLLNITSGNALSATALIFWQALTAASSVELILAVAIITLLISVLSNCGLLERMVEHLSTLLSNPKLAIIGIPALIGAIPISGGAVISAPLVGEIGPQLSLTNRRLAAINNIFRHIFIFVLPFRPQYILAASLAMVPLADFVKVQVPYTVFGVLIAYWFLLRTAPVESKKNKPIGERLLAGGKFLLSSSPFGIILVGAVLGLKLSITLTFGLGLALFLARNHPNFKFLKIIRDVKYQIILTMAAIVIFSNSLQNVDVLPQLLDKIIANGISVELMIFIIPLIIGYITGDITATVAIVFPLLNPLLPVGDIRIYYICTIYATSLISYMVSPLHLCLVLTNDYFKVNILQVYREHWLITLLFFVSIIIIFLLRINFSIIS